MLLHAVLCDKIPFLYFVTVIYIQIVLLLMLFFNPPITDWNFNAEKDHAGYIDLFLPLMFDTRAPHLLTQITLFHESGPCHYGMVKS